MLLNGKTALVTGGGTGIGRAAAIRLAEEGAHVWIAGRNETTLRETQSLIGARCSCSACDITDLAALQKLFTSLPALDIFVSNAAVSFPTPLALEPLAEWRRMIEINLWGTVNACLCAGSRMEQDQTSGRIVIVSSILAEIAEPGSTAYGMAKAALNQLARQLAVEWAGKGILVNTIAPGMIHTPMSYVSGENECESEWFKRFFIHPDRPRLPLRRAGRPEEIAEAVLFFANPRNSYCTGSTLTVDGGLTVGF